jgi:oxygen-independent coproporphyrinogen-3 oxidase
MVNALAKELVMRKDYLDQEKLESVYFGGGTPSLLDEMELEILLSQVYKQFQILPNAEITLEANPDDITLEKVSMWRKLGVNRLSIGVQSFFEEELKWMNRAHNADEAERSIKLAQDAGIENISIDLIFGLPISNHICWKENVNQAINAGVPHISAYALTVEEGTALAHFVKKGKAEIAPDEYTMEQFDITHEMLTSNGFLHYEISNYGKPGQLAVHNTNYWKSKPYLGVGPSAHSYNGIERCSNVAHNHHYMKAIGAGSLDQEVERIEPDTKYNEFVMTRVRTMWGIHKKEVKEMGDKYWSHMKEVANSLIERQWLTELDNHYQLTRTGMHYADGVAMELFI